ncbi:MAG: hypothetical protein Q7W02_02345 [Candidatus Rokubacteria bacterium]|nr:hypothetical protein [Candidatus Rokubacteria bacterium]
MSTPILAAPKRLSDEKFMDAIDKLKPNVFPAVVAGKVDTGTITATCFNLINADGQRLAALTTNDNGCPGLVFFHPGSDGARLEVMLEAAGPVVKFNDAKGRQRLRVHIGPGDTPAVFLTGATGLPRISLMVDRDHPRVILFPRGARHRSVVAGVPFPKIPEPRAWARAMRAARSNKRAAFETAALDAGFLTPELLKLWNFARRRLRHRPVSRARKVVA